MTATATFVDDFWGPLRLGKNLLEKKEFKISSFFSDFCATKLGSNFVFLFLQKLVPKLATFVNWPEKQTLQDTKPEKQKKRTKTSFCSQLLCAYKVVSQLTLDFGDGVMTLTPPARESWLLGVYTVLKTINQYICSEIPKTNRKVSSKNLIIARLLSLRFLK